MCHLSQVNWCTIESKVWLLLCCSILVLVHYSGCISISIIKLRVFTEQNRSDLSRAQRESAMLLFTG